ncbi:uncharacterized protein LOC143252283 [Tachypleus tridentatus]|uniref:uncharacterized protein LOC143252283 n=1 Tax=Tachypleus tridentatus TaxID=6853 RepID=UPI003FD30C2E
MEYPENKCDGSDTQKLISCDTSVDCSRKDDLKKSKVIGDCRKINQDSSKKNDCYKKSMEKVVESKDSFSVQCVGVKIQNSDISKVSSQDLDITIKSKRECEENLEHDKCDSSNVLKQKEHDSYVKCVTDTCMLEKKGYYCEVSDVLCSEGLSSKNKINEEILEEADSKKDKIEEKLEGNNELSKVTGVLNLSSPEGQRHLSNLRKEIDILNEAGKLRPEYSSVCFGTPEKEVNQKEPKISLKRKDREEKNETCEKVQKKKKRKRQTIDTKEYEELLEGIDGEIDRVLEERAKRNRLTAANVKNILKHVITNEHVLSMVRNTMRSEEGVDSEIEEAVYEPKLTRSKVKELREKQGNLSWAFSPMKTSSMSKKLLEDDFSDDDSSLDDEYNPGMEIHNSDDDDDTESVLSSQASELGSPLPVHNASAVHSQENVDEDSTRVQLPDSTTDLKTEEDRIALRTRSKLPLIDTPLEAIEAAFVAPDITPDMYDSDCDDEEWRNFLNDFRKPLETCVNTDGREDEGEDPEYNFLEDDDILDKWDLRFDRAVKIPKREVQELMAEILQTTQQDLADGEEEEDRNTNNIPRLPLPSSALASTPSDTGTSPDVDGRRLLTNIHITDQMKSLLNQQMRMVIKWWIISR